MKQQEVFKKVGTILKELKDQYDYLGSTDEAMNDLELELFVANAHFLAEHSEVLRKLNQQNMPPPVIKQEPPKKTAEKYFEPVVQQAEPELEAPKKAVETPAAREDKPVPHIDLAANGADDDFSVMRRDEPEIIKHELVLDESEIYEDEDDTGFEIEETPESEEKIKETPKVKEAKPEAVKETPKPEPKKETPLPIEVPRVIPAVEAQTETGTEEKLTINQMISAQMNKGKAAEQVHIQPISDLKQAITLNDKLLYIKDLFNGYNLAYSEAIDILNRYSTFEEAEHFLNTNYAAKNHWDTKQATADKFFALLRRRYS